MGASNLITDNKPDQPRWQTALNLAAGALWQMPGNFAITSALHPGYSLRCVLFHHVADTESPFTSGMGITIRRRTFEAALKFLTRHYTPVRLADILAEPGGRNLPPRPVLVTFDDAYASVVEFAIPLCEQFGVPGVFFVNASCLDNQQLALDNLICYAVNVMGLDTVNAVARAVLRAGDLQLHSMGEIFNQFLPGISPGLRGLFANALSELTGDTRELARKAHLYLTRTQLRSLPAHGFEIGNHTYSHIHCRTLALDNLALEIDRNKMELEAASGTKVRSFSVPYGSSADLTPEVAQHLCRSGHEAAFLSESVANCDTHNMSHFDRISTHGDADKSLFLEIEVLPRLRRLRNELFRSRDAVHSRRLDAGTMTN